MKMMRIRGMIVLLALVAASAAPVRAAQVGGPGHEVTNQIFVANHSATSVRVYLEDAAGERYELGRVDRGDTSMFEAPEEAVAGGDFRVVVRPWQYTQFSRDAVSIKTEELEVGNDATVILWLERDLSRSKVEVRQS
jgi:hypothetical protein